MPMANFTTDGKTTTQSALSKTFCGMLSGAFRISCITFPEFSTRSCSFFCAEAGAASTANNPTDSHAFFIDPPPGHILRIPFYAYRSKAYQSLPQDQDAKHW